MSQSSSSDSLSRSSSPACGGGNSVTPCTPEEFYQACALALGPPCFNASIVGARIRIKQIDEVAKLREAMGIETPEKYSADWPYTFSHYLLWYYEQEDRINETK